MLRTAKSRLLFKKTPAFFIILVAIVIVVAVIGIYKYDKTTGYSTGVRQSPGGYTKFARRIEAQGRGRERPKPPIRSRRLIRLKE